MYINLVRESEPNSQEIQARYARGITSKENENIAAGYCLENEGSRRIIVHKEWRKNVEVFLHACTCAERYFLVCS